MNKEAINTINKPMSVAKDEFVENLISLVNNNNLPLFVTESILKDFLTDIAIAVKEQTRMEKAQYEQMLKQQAEQMAKENSDKIDEDRK